jgi:ribonuclease P protein component
LLCRPTLGAAERIKSTKEFDGLFKNGSSFFLPPLRVVYRFDVYTPAEAPAQVAFAAPKRQFKKAVQRNYIKRRMREAYRQLKPKLYETLLHQNRKLLLVFVCQQNVEKISVAQMSGVISKAIERLTRD